MAFNFSVNTSNGERRGLHSRQLSDTASQKQRNRNGAILLVVLVVLLILGLGLGLGLHLRKRKTDAATVADDLLFPNDTASDSHPPNDTVSDNAPTVRLNIPLDRPLVGRNFPDPGYIEVNGSYYAFASGNTGLGQAHLQMAKSTNFETWSVIDKDPLPNVGRWSTGNEVWSPDVVKLDSGKFLLYYAAQLLDDKSKHCVHAALADQVEGPYAPISDNPLVCPVARGGAVDPDGFRDRDGTRYLVYKIDGNSLNKAKQPPHPTPIMLQKLKEDGVTPEGEAVHIHDWVEGEGNSIATPSLGLFNTEEGKEPVYVLFYSTHMFNAKNAGISYATSKSVGGPYTRGHAHAIQTGDRQGQLNGPASLDLGDSGSIAVMDSITSGEPGQSRMVRSMWGAKIEVSENMVTII